MRARIALVLVLTTAAWAAPSLAYAQVLNGLVVYLPFNGGVADSSGSGNNGSVVRPFNGSGSDPGNFTAGVNGAPGFGSSFRTRGTNSGTANVANNNYVTLGNNPLVGLDYANPSTSYSVSFWTRYSAANLNADPAFFSNKNWLSGSNQGFVVSANGTANWKWNQRNTADTRRDLNATNIVNNDAWHHIVATFDRSIPDGLGTSYFDGALSGIPVALGLQGSLAMAALPINIFQDGTGSYTDGTTQAIWLDAAMDDFGVWNRVISPAEVAGIFGAGQLGLPLSAIPEPGSLALAGIAVGGYFVRRRRKSSTAKS